MTITATSIADNSFTNTGGLATADIFNLFVTGNFDYATDYLNNGTIRIINAYLNLQCSLVILFITNQPMILLGRQAIVLLSQEMLILQQINYTQYGAIDVAGVWTINANNYTYNRLTDDFIGTHKSLVVSGNADIIRIILPMTETFLLIHLPFQ